MKPQGQEVRKKRTGGLRLCKYCQDCIPDEERRAHRSKCVKRKQVKAMAKAETEARAAAASRKASQYITRAAAAASAAAHEHQASSKTGVNVVNGSSWRNANLNSGPLSPTSSASASRSSRSLSTTSSEQSSGQTAEQSERQHQQQRRTVIYRSQADPCAGMDTDTSSTSTDRASTSTTASLVGRQQRLQISQDGEGGTEINGATANSADRDDVYSYSEDTSGFSPKITEVRSLANEKRVPSNFISPLRRPWKEFPTKRKTSPSKIPPPFKFTVNPCTTCSQVFTSKQARSQHVCDLSGPAPTTSRKLNLSQTAPVCLECDKQFNSNKELYQHKLSTHVGQNYNCPGCKYGFITDKQMVKPNVPNCLECLKCEMIFKPKRQDLIIDCGEQNDGDSDSEASSLGPPILSPHYPSSPVKGNTPPTPPPKKRRKVVTNKEEIELPKESDDDSLCSDKEHIRRFTCPEPGCNKYFGSQTRFDHHKQTHRQLEKHITNNEIMAKLTELIPPSHSSEELQQPEVSSRTASAPPPPQTVVHETTTSQIPGKKNKRPWPSSNSSVVSSTSESGPKKFNFNLLLTKESKDTKK